jgi:AcrR family transcriptional regulator
VDKAMSPTSRPTRNVTRTRDDLLAAGAHLLATDPSHAFGVLKASHVARQAGRTTGAFFNIWPTQEAYLDDLVDYVLSPERGTTGAAVGEVVAEGLSTGADEDEVLLAIAEVVLAEVPSDPQTVLELLLWSRAHGDGALRRHLAERYQILDEASAEAFTIYLRHNGRRMRRGFTAEQLSATMQDVSQIVGLREAVAHGTYSAEHLAALYRLILEYMTCSADDRRTPAAFLRSLRRRPARRRTP